MSLLTVTGVVLRMGGRTLLERADLTVDPGRRIGLVGRNGAGKSTLLKAISGDLAVDGGDIRISSRARMAQVKQTAPSGPVSLIDTVLAADTERVALLAQVDRAERGEIPPDQVGAIYERLQSIDADSAPARAATILAGLGFDAEAQGRALDEFSGGWRMRVALASVLFSNPDLLLLDEPTNHLDLEATLWLEGWLAKFPGAALVVSHDQGLLDRAVQFIAHLDQRRLNMTPGGYSEFVRIRTEQAMQTARAAEKITAQRAHMQAFVDRFRASASKARQAQSRLRALEKMPAMESVIEDHVTRFAFPEPGRLAPPILALDNVSVGYDGRAVLHGLSVNFGMADRIALLGPNGNGKSTFAKLLAGRLAPMSGQVRRPSKLRVGYFAQHQEAELVPSETALDHIGRALPQAPPNILRSQLARFGLDADRANTPSASLSGGERARLLLALATRDAPQLLILDEPTNHLDIDACDALVRALGEFQGAVLLITHDPHLVELVADQLWLVDGGTIRPYEGDMDDYRALLLKKGKPVKAASAGLSKKDERRMRAQQRMAAAAA
jgi:ATP-binding cassette subfamily F protein 3